MEILSDTKGVDFGPYLQQALYRIKRNWYNLIPAVAKPPLNKSGISIIEFAILKNGKLGGMKVSRASGDQNLDRAAWGGITASNPFEPLPAQYLGNYLGLRIKFVYNQPTGSFNVPLGTFNVPPGIGVDPHYVPPGSQGNADAALPTQLDQSEDIKVISDTRGLDLNSYLQHLVLSIQERWYQLIPDQAKKSSAESGTVIVRFAILPDGSVARMRLSGPSGNADLDQAAWSSILESSPLAPLPKKFTGTDLVVSLRFAYNPKIEDGKRQDTTHVLVFSSDDPLRNTITPKHEP